ncbi:aspartate-semialdehyde dehydrogenase [Candidatus Gottesmanbacteria bacterium]|nr:aspartate-semialdehyde dehydrogenase [Candidatus Gottesmanbacteria bacterium]
MKKIRVGILGATGMVGQRFATLLANHPWFEVVALAASPASKGKIYQKAVKGRWKIDKEIPKTLKNVVIQSVEEDIDEIVRRVDLVFSALDLEKNQIKKIEEYYASKNMAVVSNNSTNRWVEDVPMIMPEINPEHIKLIDVQRKNRGWKKGFIVVKPNCSIQSYVSILTTLHKFQPQKVHVVSMQSISGAGKTFDSWPEMVDNVIPNIAGEEEKSEKEPLKIWGKIRSNKIALAKKPEISATCIRIPSSNGHMTSVSVSFGIKPSKKQLLSAIKNYKNPIEKLHLPSAPREFINYFEEENRPQSKLDRNLENGMGISMGRLREDKHFDWKFIALSHNTIRGAAGGAILLAELLVNKGYI